MIRVFIGTEPKTEIARKVLCFSIEKNTSQPVEFYPMMGDSWVIRPNPYIGTGFSLFRWDIPKKCNYEGFAIYLDADILCLSDIKELWGVDTKYPNETCSVWCTYQPSKWDGKPTPETSVMLIDCKKAKENQPSMEDSLTYILNDPKPQSRDRYIKIMRGLKHQTLPQEIPVKFNRLNSIVRNEDNVFLHYTKEPDQPWYKPSHKFAPIWREHLVEALKADYVSKDEIRDAIESFVPHTPKKRGQGLHPDYKKIL